MPPIVGTWEEYKLLVVVKAYPEIGKRTGEGVCTAGITSDGKWMRIFPVHYRELPKDKQFAKWQWIKFQAKKAIGDSRPESYKVREDTLVLSRCLDSVKDFDERKRFLHKGCYNSVEDMLSKDASLGVIQPMLVEDLKIVPNKKKGSCDV